MVVVAQLYSRIQPTEQPSSLGEITSRFRTLRGPEQCFSTPSPKACWRNARKAADIVALYLNPPQNALILAIDKKPAIQALERAQGWIRLPNG
jgi:hypothetical protein